MKNSTPHRRSRCPGCDVPLSKRVYISSKWKTGDPISPRATVHIDEKGKRFVMTNAMQRAYFKDSQ